MLSKVRINFQNQIIESILCGFFLLVGLIIPFSWVDYSFYLLFVMLAFFLIIPKKGFNDNKVYFCILALVVTLALLKIYFLNEHFFVPSLLAIFLGFFSYSIVLKLFKNPRNILLFLIILVFVLSSIYNSRDLRQNVLSHEPRPREYFNDHLEYLRKFILFEKGYDYYQSVVITELEDGRGGEIPPFYWNWRFPYLNYLWKVFPGSGGVSIYVFFLFLATITLVSAYLISKHFLSNHKSAILVPYFLLGYFHFPARDISFIDFEWWTMMFMVIGLLFLFKFFLKLSFLFTLSALLVRELYFIPVSFLIFIFFLSKRYYYALTFVLAIMFFVLGLFAHYFRVSAFLPIDLNSILPNSHSPDFFTFQQTLAFNSWEYLFLKFRPFLLILSITLISTLTLSLKKKINIEAITLLVIPYILIIAVLINGTRNGDYWGITYVPFLLISSVILTFNLFVKNEKRS